VEVLVSDHRLHRLEVGVGGAVLVGQDVARVEDVEALVLHRAHGEILGGDDVEHVEVVAAAEALLVPAHGAQGGAQRVLAARREARLGPDIDLDVVAFGGDEGRRHALHAAGGDREQVAGLGMRILPARIVAAVLQLAAAGRIAVGQQHRVARALGAQLDRIDAEHVRAIDEERDAAEALGLALGQQQGTAGVEPFERGVGGRRDRHPAAQHAGLTRALDVQAMAVVAVVAGPESAPVELQPFELQALAVQLQRLAAAAALGLQPQLGFDLRALGVELEHEADARNAPGRWAIVAAKDERRLGHVGSGPEVIA